MIWVLLGIAVLTSIFVRAPGRMNAVILVLSLLLGTGLVFVNSLGQTTAPLILFTVVLSQLVIAGSPLVQKIYAVPHLRKLRAQAGNKVGSALGMVETLDYEILEKVGSGGMANVYRARRLADDQIVALKLPMEQYVTDSEFIRRFHHEAEIARRLDHRNIVKTFDHGTLGIKHFIAMEFTEGRSLEGYIKTGDLDTELSIDVMQFVVNALQHIHSFGFIHRDIKPTNIMILRGGVQTGRPRVRPDAVKLMDFGIASRRVLSRLTTTDVRMGTPIYMSPEQARGLEIDHRSDIYSLGLVFYEMLTGQMAFQGGYEAIVHQQIFQTPPSPHQLNPAIPQVLDQLVMRMIAKNPTERPTLDEVFESLRRKDLEGIS